jgi:hypothetical protein
MDNNSDISSGLLEAEGFVEGDLGASVGRGRGVRRRYRNIFDAGSEKENMSSFLANSPKRNKRRVLSLSVSNMEYNALLEGSRRINLNLSEYIRKLLGLNVKTGNRRRGDKAIGDE